VITDKYSHWALEYTENVLAGYTHIQTFWDSTASLSIILNLLINSVASTLGELSEERFNQLRDLGIYFEEFTHAKNLPAKQKKSRKKADPN
jgi:DNA-binding MurR/RpiR family transcriptional regulator